MAALLWAPPASSQELPAVEVPEVTAPSLPPLPPLPPPPPLPELPEPAKPKKPKRAPVPELPARPSVPTPEADRVLPESPVEPRKPARPRKPSRPSVPAPVRPDTREAPETRSAPDERDEPVRTVAPVRSTTPTPPPARGPSTARLPRPADPADEPAGGDDAAPSSAESLAGAGAAGNPLAAGTGGPGAQVGGAATTVAGVPPATAVQRGATALLGALGGELFGTTMGAALNPGAGAVERTPSQKRLVRAVEQAGGCVSGLSRGQRRVLVLRAGLAGGRPLSRRQTASRLDVSTGRVRRLERQAISVLRREDGCAGGAAVATGGGPGVAVAAGASAPGSAALLAPGAALAAFEAPLGEIAGVRASGSQEGAAAAQEQSAVRGRSLQTPLGSFDPDSSGSLGLALLFAGLAGLTALVVAREVRRQLDLR